MQNCDNKLNLRQNTVCSVTNFTQNPENFTPSRMVWMVTFSKSLSFQVSKRGRTNERPRTDHVISGPIRGLEKNCTRWRRHLHTRTWPLYDQLGPVGPSWWKSRIRETTNLSTDADSSTDTKKSLLIKAKFPFKKKNCAAILHPLWAKVFKSEATSFHYFSSRILQI